LLSQMSWSLPDRIAWRGIDAKKSEANLVDAPLTLLCGRNCQAFLSALSSLLLDTAPPLLIIRLSHAHTGSVDE
jgi:hypothetical protein